MGQDVTVRPDSVPAYAGVASITLSAWAGGPPPAVVPEPPVIVVPATAPPRISDRQLAKAGLILAIAGVLWPSAFAAVGRWIAAEAETWHHLLTGDWYR